MSRIWAIIEARSDSSRLPNKVMLPLGGRPIIHFIVERLRRSHQLSDICVATTDDLSDDRLVESLSSNGIKYFRGSSTNVLEIGRAHV